MARARVATSWSPKPGAHQRGDRAPGTGPASCPGRRGPTDPARCRGIGTAPGPRRPVHRTGDGRLGGRPKRNRCVSSPCRADHQEGRAEHRRSVRGVERRSRRRPPNGAALTRRRRASFDDVVSPRRQDRGEPWTHRDHSDFPFDVNLLVVHPDHMTDFVLDSGPGLFEGRYTIGLSGLGPGGALRIDGRRGAHGARGVDADVVGFPRSPRRC